MTDDIDHPSPLKPLAGASALAHASVLALCLGYTAMVLLHDPPLAAMVNGALLSVARRAELMKSLMLWSVVAATLMAAVFFWLLRVGGRPVSLGESVAAVWPLSLLPLACYVTNIAVWSEAPLLLFAVTSAACAYCVVRSDFPRLPWSPTIPPAAVRFGPGFALAAAITAYVVYVSVHTILNHRALGTAAYDLGIHENTLWNTLNGSFFHSSLEGGSHLGVHTSFIMLVMLPVYALAPLTETVLIIQAVVIGLAALPLYLLTRQVLEHRGMALVVAIIWLVHPAVGGANFYDFHAVVFAPVLLFTAAYLWWNERWRSLWITIALLLAVKEEMAILVVLLGLVSLVTGRRRQGVALMIVGVATYLVLQNLVIPHFAGGEHSYAWYYPEVIPKGEGPRGLVTTGLLNPIFALGFTLTEAKVLFLFQIFAPLAFLPFFTARGAVLVSYGVAATVLASRPPLYTVGFQYALTLLAMAFIGGLLGFQRLSHKGRRRALAAAVLLTIVTCYHYGMIWPRHNFTGGFHTIDFDYSDGDRDRYLELVSLTGQIPDDATVLAGESLVPHIARRHTVGTARYARDGIRKWDYILLHNDASVERLRRVPRFRRLIEYETVQRTESFVLFRHRVSAESGGSDGSSQ